VPVVGVIDYFIQGNTNFSVVNDGNVSTSANLSTAVVLDLGNTTRCVFVLSAPGWCLENPLGAGAEW
jgi:hypothetical protein